MADDTDEHDECYNLRLRVYELQERCSRLSRRTYGDSVFMFIVGCFAMLVVVGVLEMLSSSRTAAERDLIIALEAYRSAANSPIRAWFDSIRASHSTNK